MKWSGGLTRRHCCRKGGLRIWVQQGGERQTRPPPNCPPPSLPALLQRVLPGAGGKGSAGHPSLTGALIAAQPEFLLLVWRRKTERSRSKLEGLLWWWRELQPSPPHKGGSVPLKGRASSPSPLPILDLPIRAGPLGPASLSASQCRVPSEAGSLASLL